MIPTKRQRRSQTTGILWLVEMLLWSAAWIMKMAQVMEMA